MLVMLVPIKTLVRLMQPSNAKFPMPADRITVNCAWDGYRPAGAVYPVMVIVPFVNV